MRPIFLVLLVVSPTCDEPERSGPTHPAEAPVASARVDAQPCDGLEADARAICDVLRGSGERVTGCALDAFSRGASGRFAVGFTIVEGVVTEARLVTNDTGDDALGACVVDVVRALRFDPALSATVAEYPWVLVQG